ncbi:glycosyltransferase [Trinickia dabaoshanensis]|uniref:Glycosyltransferase n=1 Tax=Trinickia dabaoshanensis TaxID=564714 RepID=A0A2N7VUP1_9BURK|nr:glycosyltransferase [Trinickia dabaoshanensis]PMS20876.1 glycosyltransferase [Trinickia dabaoshanensis]
MKFTVATYGTEGDTRPLAALCRALMDAGHETRLLADGATLHSAHALGVPCSPLSGDIKEALMPGASLGEIVGKHTGVQATAKALAAIANANTAAWMREVKTAADGSDAIIVSALASFVGLSVAEHLRIPAIGASMIPITPTREFASPFLQPGIVPGFLHRMSHTFVNGMIWRAFRRATNAARVEVCSLAPRTRNWTDHPILYGVSRTLLPQPADWPAHAMVCGQWAAPVDDDREWSPPEALSTFLQAGEPPIYVGFGSMAGFDRERLLPALIEAIGGRRALFYPGWSGNDASRLPPNFHVVGETSHAWLFPRVALVVHHGGSGTTHSATRAGKPSVVVPFAGDQCFWADRLHRLGVAAPAVDGNAPTAAAFASAIDFGLLSTAQARAEQLGAAMREEDGLRAAVAAIERLAAAGQELRSVGICPVNAHA